mmetsp:Transcript_33381/g.105792  ORF Transcript_33381/g.105792 Transcript_33381/m.105792 type:complete len:249 (+) Transcript_33381:884-1630(+)
MGRGTGDLSAVPRVVEVAQPRLGSQRDLARRADASARGLRARARAHQEPVAAPVRLDGPEALRVGERPRAPRAPLHPRRGLGRRDDALPPAAAPLAAGGRAGLRLLRLLAREAGPAGRELLPGRGARAPHRRRLAAAGRRALARGRARGPGLLLAPQALRPGPGPRRGCRGGGLGGDAAELRRVRPPRAPLPGALRALALARARSGAPGGHRGGRRDAHVEAHELGGGRTADPGLLLLAAARGRPRAG